MHRTFSLWTHVLSVDADSWYRGVFAKYSYSLGLNQHMICFLLQCNAPCLEGSEFFTVLCTGFSFDFLCGEISKWIKKDTKG